MQSLCISIYPNEDSVQTAPCSKLLSVQSEILSETLKVLRVNKGPSEVWKSIKVAAVDSPD